MRHLQQFGRGMGMTILPLGLGVCIARYIPPRVIGVASLLLLAFVIYLAGALRFPWERR
jgi:hypothetical protein